MKKLLTLFAVCIFLLCECRKTENSSSIKASKPLYFWSNYIGTYDVYDTLNHTQWVMKISHIGPHNAYNNGNEDSVLIENFANLFTIRDKWQPAVDSKINQPAFFLYGYNPLKDMYGFKWELNSKGYQVGEILLKNVLVRDTISINYQQSNIAWYIADGVPYYACADCKHIAVKRPN